MQTTPLHAVHRCLGARMIPFGGWDMPVSYRDIMSEHRTVRDTAGLFDLSHMGRLRFDGPDRVAFLEALLSNRTADMIAGEARYAVMTDERGHAIDDTILYRFSDHDLLVVNASNREADLVWIAEQTARLGLQPGLTDRTFEVAMLAVQGPTSLNILEPLSEGFDLPGLAYYRAAYGRVAGIDALFARTGYTGENGYELYFAAAQAERLWSLLLEAGQPNGLRPIGLGARDTLRLEAGMPLYGHELTRETSPLEAGLGFFVKLKGRTFPGRDALAKERAAKPQKKLVCLYGDGRRIPREGYAVTREGETIGAVTSGTFSPTLERPIAMALVAREQAVPGAEVVIDVRGKPLPARIGKRPFYKRAR